MEGIQILLSMLLMALLAGFIYLVLQNSITTKRLSIVIGLVVFIGVCFTLIEYWRAKGSADLVYTQCGIDVTASTILFHETKVKQLYDFCFNDTGVQP